MNLNIMIDSYTWVRCVYMAEVLLVTEEETLAVRGDEAVHFLHCAFTEEGPTRTQVWRSGAQLCRWRGAGM